MRTWRSRWRQPDASCTGARRAIQPGQLQGVLVSWRTGQVGIATVPLRGHGWLRTGERTPDAHAALGGLEKLPNSSSPGPGSRR